MKRLFVVLAAAALAAGCEQASTPQTVPAIMPNDHSLIGNRVLGDATTPGQFEVIGRPGNGPTHYWCSAGDYVINKVHLLPNQRIYIVKPRGPSATRPGSTSVVFTVLPDADVLAAAEALPAGDYSLSISAVGANFLAAHGESTCRSITPFFWDLPE
ncbi:hypothetical protein [Actibacterium sp. D379-3]